MYMYEIVSWPLLITAALCFTTQVKVELYQHLVGPWCLTIVPGQPGNFFIEIMCWAPRISQVRSTGLLSIFLRAQPCYFKKP